MHPVFSMPRCVAAYVALCLLLGAASAQTPQAPAPPVDPAEAGGAGVDPIRIGPITLSGSAWLEGFKVNGDDDDQALDTMRVRRARVGLAGSLAPRIGWNISGEFTAEPILRNAFVLLRLHDLLHIRAGQATPPSGLERGTSPLALELIDRSRVTTQLTSGLDPSVTVMSDEPYRGWVSYAVSVANGSGFNRADNNDAKDLVGRVEITPPNLAGVSVVASGSSGEQPEGRRTRAGLGAQYNVARFKLAAEAMQQRQAWTDDAQGFYALAVYRVRPRTATPHFRMVELAARYVVMDDPASARGGSEVIDEDGGAPAPAAVPATTRELQAGGNYYVNRNLRVMLNAIQPFDERPGTTALARVQIVF